MTRDLPAASAPTAPRHVGAMLQGVAPCFGRACFGESPACGSTRRIVLGFGHPVAGLYVVECAKCGEQSSMRPADVERCAPTPAPLTLLPGETIGDKLRNKLQAIRSNVEHAQRDPADFGDRAMDILAAVDVAVPWTVQADLALQTLASQARDLTRTLLEADGPCPSCGIDTAEQEVEQHEPDCALMALSKAVS